MSKNPGKQKSTEISPNQQGKSKKKTKTQQSNATSTTASGTTPSPRPNSHTKETPLILGEKHENGGEVFDSEEDNKARSVLHTLGNKTRNLRNKMKKFSKLEQELKDEVNFNLEISKKKKSTANATETPLLKVDLSPHVPDLLLLVETGHQTVKELEGLQANLVKYLQDIENKTKKLQITVDSLKQENQKKSNLIQQNEKKIADLTKEVQIAKGYNKDLLTQIQSKHSNDSLLEKQILDQQKTIEHQKAKLIKLQRMNELEKEIESQKAKYEQQLEQLSNEKYTLQQEIYSLKGENNVQCSTIQKQQQIISKQNEDISYNSKITKDMAESEKALQKQIQQLKQQVKMENERAQRLEIDMKKMKEETEKEKQQTFSELQNSQQQLSMQLGRIQEQYEKEKQEWQHQYHQLGQQYQQQLQEHHLQQQIQQEQQKQNYAIGEILIEEEILDTGRERRKQSSMTGKSNSVSDLDDEVIVDDFTHDVIKIVQLIDFFDKTKPDGMDLRAMFLGDQISSKQDGNTVHICSHEDFEAFDFLSKAVRGALVEDREESVSNALSHVQRLLRRSTEEIIPQITYQVLANQVTELASSSIYLNGSPLYPYAEIPASSSNLENPAENMDNENDNSTEDNQLNSMIPQFRISTQGAFESQNSQHIRPSQSPTINSPTTDSSFDWNSGYGNNVSHANISLNIQQPIPAKSQEQKQKWSKDNVANNTSNNTSTHVDESNSSIPNNNDSSPPRQTTRLASWTSTDQYDNGQQQQQQQQQQQKEQNQNQQHYNQQHHHHHQRRRFHRNWNKKNKQEASTSQKSNADGNSADNNQLNRSTSGGGSGNAKGGGKTSGRHNYRKGPHGRIRTFYQEVTSSTNEQNS